MVACDDSASAQKWTLSPSGQLSHDNTGLCLDMGQGEPGQEISVTTCDQSPRQTWMFDYYEADKESWRPDNIL